jgi:hypothetical protein
VTVTAVRQSLSKLADGEYKAMRRMTGGGDDGDCDWGNMGARSKAACTTSSAAVSIGLVTWRPVCRIRIDAPRCLRPVMRLSNMVSVAQVRQSVK